MKIQSLLTKVKNSFMLSGNEVVELFKIFAEIGYDQLEQGGDGPEFEIYKLMSNHNMYSESFYAISNSLHYFGDYLFKASVMREFLRKTLSIADSKRTPEYPFFINYIKSFGFTEKDVRRGDLEVFLQIKIDLHEFNIEYDAKSTSSLTVFLEMALEDVIVDFIAAKKKKPSFILKRYKNISRSPLNNSKIDFYVNKYYQKHRKNTGLLREMVHYRVLVSSCGRVPVIARDFIDNHQLLY